MNKKCCFRTVSASTFLFFFLLNTLFGISGNLVMSFQEKDEVKEDQISLSTF